MSESRRGPISESTDGTVTARSYRFPTDEMIAGLSEQERNAEYERALAAGWSGAEAAATLWPESERKGGLRYITSLLRPGYTTEPIRDAD